MNTSARWPDWPDVSGVQSRDPSAEHVSATYPEQWLLIRGQDRTRPVLLVLHGGPGTPLTPWVDMFQPAELEENFVVVHWDQRGAGKSYDPDLPASALTIDNYVSDTLELSNPPA